MARHVDISHINERRLRPIYDCLDNNNNKKALQEAEKVLKKQKDLQCARVLKALALLRLGRESDSQIILDQVHNEAPTDDATLQAMTICYRELHKISSIANVYELAVKKDPTNEELFSHLFMAYVRMSDYKKQQLVAMNLYKLKPKNPYYFWAVMSIFMQANYNEQSIAQKVTLPLAEKMCRKFIDEGKIEAEAELELYLMILEKQEKYEEMLNVIEGPLGSKYLANIIDFIPRRKANLLFLMKRYTDAFEEYKRLIENNLDQVDYYLQLYDIACLLDDNMINSHNQDNNSETQTCCRLNLIKFIDKCIDKSNRASTNRSSTSRQLRLRGPYIARILIIELLKKQIDHSDLNCGLNSDLNTGLNCLKTYSTNDLLFEYFENFASKFACIYDMFYMISKCELRDFDKLLLTIKQSLLNLDDVNKDLDFLQRNLCYYYLSYYTGQHDNLSVDERNKLIDELIGFYDGYIENISPEIEITQTEPQPADQFIMLIGQILVYSNTIFQDETVFQLLAILERALIKSPTNYYIKIFLMKIYNLLGAVEASHNLFETLDIKHIQYDTLGYLMANPLIIAGQFSTASQLLGGALRFYSANYKDTLDYLISCYKYGSFSKVDEIIKLRDRLNNSLQYCYMAVERMILDLILETKDHKSTENIINYMEIDPEKDKFIWENLCDNRDFNVLRSNHLENDRIIQENKVDTFKDEILWLKIRNLLIRAIAASHYSVSDYGSNKTESKNELNNGTSNGTDKKSYSDILVKHVCILREYIETIKSSKFSDNYLPIEGPQPSRICLYSKQNHLEIILALFDTIIALQEESKEYFFTLKSLEEFSLITHHIDQIFKDKLTLYSMRANLEQLVNCVETLSISLILIGIIKLILKTKINIHTKKNKKKKDNTSDTNLVDSYIKNYANLVNGFEEEALKILNIIKSFDIKMIFKQNISEEIVNPKSTYLLKDFNDNVGMIEQKLQKSYLKSLKEINDLIHIKIKYLQSLKI